MQQGKRLGWAVLALLAASGLPHATFGASDKALEDRVRALEQKLDQSSTQGATQQQSVEDRIKAIETEVKDDEKNMAALLGIEIHGLLATNYNYNFNTPDSHTNKIHVFDQDANSIELDQANLNIQRKKPDGLSFNLDVDFGKTAEVVGASTHWSNNSSNTESNNSIELRQAFFTYAFKDTPFSITAGKFVTFHGAEVIKSYNNINFNISNSILFGFAVPFTHTGVYGTYTLPSDLGSLSIGAVNGWDNPVDNNDSKSVTGMLTLTPAPMFTFALPTTYGSEQTNNGESKRFLISPLFTIKPMDTLTLIAEYDYGNESNVALSCPPGVVCSGTLNTSSIPAQLLRAPGNAMWEGAAGYVIYAATDDIQLALRGEVFDDPDGVRTLFQEPGFGPGQTLWEATLTGSYKITDGLFWRNEYRHDESDKRFFDKNNVEIRGQDLLETELIYTF